ncbi:hypothetical protein BDZ45DRAFT_730880 [Acephala macrosclerotiorum]|nr:hypothetical protein BDZ45DRAFT_730880 [Acephala macrosclerotiorum]
MQASLSPEVTFGQLYGSAWQGTIKGCEATLERHDLSQVSQCPDASYAQSQIEELGSKRWELARLIQSLSNLCCLTTRLEENLESNLGMPFFWGVLLLTVRLASQTPNAARNIARMIKDLGHQADLLNNISSQDFSKSIQTREAGLDVTLAILEFFISVIAFFRKETFDDDDSDVWSSLELRFNQTHIKIGTYIDRIERLIRTIGSSKARIDDLTKLQEMMSLSGDAQSKDGKLPCFMLPLVRNHHFFDRDDAIAKINKHFSRTGTGVGQPHSLALYGLGGVGKSAVALKYAYSRIDELDAILWVRSETPTALAQSFTDIAMRLEIHDAHPQHHIKNRVLVLNWLQHSNSKWLMIFDNAEDGDVLLDYWPLASRGMVLVTTRNHSLSFDVADSGLEISHFNAEEGPGFILHLLSIDIANNLTHTEAQSAAELSNRLNGHALAISAIWRLSFISLTPSAKSLLGVLSFVMPDSIPQALFMPANSEDLPASMRFCADEFDFSEVLEILLTLALIKRDRKTKDLSLHRLVQESFRYSLDSNGCQEAFAATATLLDKAFPTKPRDSHQMYNVWNLCQLWLQHVLHLIRQYRKESKESGGLKPTLDFCQLLVKFARYLRETGMYTELAEVLEVAFAAFDNWDERHDHQLILADLLRHRSTDTLQRGDFETSTKDMLKAIDLYHQYGGSDLAVLLAPYNHMGNVAASANRYAESLEWQEKTEAINSVEDPMRTSALTNLNLGRSLWLLGRRQEALKRYNRSIEQYLDSENWAMLAFAYFAVGNYYRQEGNLSGAAEFYTKARATWVANGQAPSNEFAASCLYKLGCVALEQGDTARAVETLQKAHTVTALRKKHLPGDYARALFKLSQALSENKQTIEEAFLKKDEAVEIIKGLLKGKPVSSEELDQEAIYDNFVCILWR